MSLERRFRSHHRDTTTTLQIRNSKSEARKKLEPQRPNEHKRIEQKSSGGRCRQIKILSPEERD